MPDQQDDTDTRKFSAAAGGGLLGFAFGGPIGVVVGAIVSSVVAGIVLDRNAVTSEDENDQGGGDPS